MERVEATSTLKEGQNGKEGLQVPVEPEEVSASIADDFC